MAFISSQSFTETCSLSDILCSVSCGWQAKCSRRRIVSPTSSSTSQKSEVTIISSSDVAKVDTTEVHECTEDFHQRDSSSRRHYCVFINNCHVCSISLPFEISGGEIYWNKERLRKFQNDYASSHESTSKWKKQTSSFVKINGLLCFKDNEQSTSFVCSGKGFDSYQDN